MYPYVTRMYLDVTHMYWYVLVSVYTFHVYYPPAIVCCSYVFVCNLYVTVCVCMYPYVTSMYPYVTCMYS